MERMKSMGRFNSNNLAGIGDPYWYEWSVGLYYALDMLNPDSDIEYITLQASVFQGLDDVLIKSKSSDKITGIQVKHTRVSDTLTYADLVLSAEGDSSSLLKKLAVDWNRAFARGWHSCEVVLFTNRNISTRKSTAPKDTSGVSSRPPLKTFWNTICSQINVDKEISIEDIKFTAEWQPAWAKLLKELDFLYYDTKKLAFLKSLSLKTDQSDLDSLIESINEKLKQHFCIEGRIAKQLDQRLCHALREWSTTLRKSEKITREDLFHALALDQDVSVGEHHLPVCEPFFQSRISFVQDLEKLLQSRTYPIIFLSGEPGCGKTNIINCLANKASSVITLRFHAFRPLLPGDQYISADEGISDSRSFWSNLLLQMRELLLGHLSEYNVPICNELLNSVGRLRTEVLRLAEEYALLQGCPTVIAIDGIDHAARAGEQNNFLKTLIPPDVVSPNVCFIIAGQPLQHYDLYPDWLSRCYILDVPPIAAEDIQFLLESEKIEFPDSSQDVIAATIAAHVAGNTLSAVFAVYECKGITSIDMLEDRLVKSGISSGIEAYYEYIWKESKRHIPNEQSYLDSRIAATLCMFTKRITPKDLSCIYAEANLPEILWERLLTVLYPIVIREENGYRVFHNDVRIYLEKYIRKDISEFESICVHLANFLFENNFDPDMKHELGFSLLCSGSQSEHLVRYYTVDYVIEAIRLCRPMKEITEQMESVLSNVGDTYDFFEWLSFSCAVETLNQYFSSLQWREKEHVEKYHLPAVLPCEKKTNRKELFTTRAIMNMFQQVNLLVTHGELKRAILIIDRWIPDMSPCDLVQQLAFNENVEYDLDYIRNESIKELLNMWGAVSYSLECGQCFSFNDDELSLHVMAQWNSGRLRAVINTQPDDFIKIISEQSIPVFHKDMDEHFLTVLEHCSSDMIMPTLSNTQFLITERTKIYLVCWAIFNKECDKCIDDLLEIIEKRLNFLPIREYERHNETNFLCAAMIVFILSVYDKIEVDKFDAIVQQALKITRGFEVKKDDRGHFSGNNLLLACVLLGNIVNIVQSDRAPSVDEKALSMIIETIFDNREGLGRAELNGRYVERFLLSAIIYLENNFSTNIQTLIFEKIALGAPDTTTFVSLNIWWQYLVEKGANKTLKVIFDKWLDIEKGVAWDCELYELHNIADQLIPLSKGLGWDDEISKIEAVLNSAQIGYVGRKDYSLYRPLEWYKSLEHKSETWSGLGLLLLNISHYASETGDNRAAVQIENAVASSAGYSGADNISRLIDVTMPQSWNDFTIILDAIIASLENQRFTEEELLNIWSTAVKITELDHSLPEYNSDNSHKIIYLADLRNAVVTHIQQNRLDDKIVNRLKEVAPFEFDIEYGPESVTFILPDRWYELTGHYNKHAIEFIEQVKEFSPQAAFDKLVTIISNKDNHYRWDFVLGFLCKLEKEDASIEPYIESLMHFLTHTRDHYFWEYDGSYRLLERLFPKLSNEQKTLLLKEIYVHYIHHKHDENVYYLNDDLGRFLHWHSTLLSEEEKSDALEKLLSTHSTWITAFKEREFPTHYSIPLEHEDKSHLSWSELCEKIERYFTDSF